MFSPLAFLFGTPLAAGAAALGAVAIPIVIHLLNRRRYRIVTWAAMRFLLAAQRKNSRRMRLEQLILLAVRCALVLLLVLAMASVMPWAEAWWGNLFPEHLVLAALGSRRTHKIVVLDGSLSMAVKLADGTAFDRARTLAEQCVSGSARGDGFSVVLMSAPPRRIVPEPSEDAPRVVREIQALRLPHGNADLAATLQTVESMLGQSPAKFEEREVYFFTDLQQATWILKQPGLVSGALHKIQDRARTIFVDVGQDGLQNLAVTGLALGVPLATVGAVLPITATVHNFGTEGRDNARLELWVGKARAAAADPPMEMRLAHQQLVRVNRGVNTFSFPYKFTTPGDYVLQVRLDGDVLDLDDTRSAVLTVKDHVPVLLVDGKSAPREVFDRAAEWLRTALNPFDSRAATGMVPFRVKVLSESQFADAGLGDLTGFDCVFLCDLARLSLPEVRRLETHVRRGGGLVIGLGDQVDLGAYNEVLYRNGQGLLPARLLKKMAPAHAAFNFAVESAAYHEPPLEAFADDNDRLSLLNARFRQFVLAEPADKGGARKILSFVPAPALPGGKNPGEGLPIGAPALLEWHPPGVRDEGRGMRDEVRKSPSSLLPPPSSPVPLRGRVVLFTSSLNMDWTTWPASPSYLALVQELTRFALAGTLRERAVDVGQPWEEFLPSAGNVLEAIVNTPDGRSETGRTQALDDSTLLRWGDTEVSGLYRVAIGQHPREHFFAVNVPTVTLGEQGSESDLARTNREDLHRAYPEWDFQLVSSLGEVVSEIRNPKSEIRNRGSQLVAQPLGPGIAHWLLLGLLVLVLVEVVLAWRFGHFLGVPSNEPPPATGRLLPWLVVVFVNLTVLPLALVLLHTAWTGDFLGFMPENSRRTVEAALGIPPPAPGEGSHWRLEFLSYLWDARSDPWLAGALALAAAGALSLIYRREGHQVSPAYKVLLGTLRLSVLLITLAVLLPQLRLWFERQAWPDVVLLIDDSHSMSTVDRFQDPKVQAVADLLAKEATLSRPERLQLAQALIGRPDQDWLTALLTQHQARLHVYHCSTRAARLHDLIEPDQVPLALQAIAELRAEASHDASLLGTALRQVLNDFRGSSLSAVIMLTDGITTEGEDLVQASRYAAQMGIPLFFIGLGDAHETRDLILHDLQADDSVFVNDRLVFEVRLTGQGFTNLTVPVRLYEKGKDQVLAEQKVAIDSQGKPVKVRLVFQPREEGEKVFELKVPVQEGEANPKNNVLERTVYVRKAKLIKVLYVEGEARWEFRYVKNLLERESNRVEGNKSIDLKVLLLDSDPDWAAQDRSALTEFPPRGELNQFDVVLLGDVDPRPGPRTPRMTEHLQTLADFVKERGGGLLMIAGQQYAPQAYRGTPLQDVLPIDLRNEPPGAEPPALPQAGYRPDLTPIGQLHPIFRFSPDEKDNLELWQNLREMYWWSEGYQPKRAAEVLAVHPKVPLHREIGPPLPRREASSVEGHPLVVQQFVGAGRSLFFGFDETWRWRWREDELRFNQFWIQTVRYLARSRTGRVELRLDKQTPYRRGEPIRVTVRFPDDSPPPPPETEVKVVSERRFKGGDGAEAEIQTMRLTKVEGSRSTFEGLLTRTPEGEYLFWLSSPLVSGTRPQAYGQVLAPPGEMEVLRMNQADMVQAAEKTQGRFYTLADADQVLADLPPGNRITLNSSGPPLTLWNHVALFALTLSLLSLEWVLRKRKHLL